MTIQLYTIVLFLITGLFFGTFFIITGLKLPLKGKGGINTCMHCEEIYAWYELIPLFSHLKKCPYCHKIKSLWFPFLELLSAFLFCLSYVLYDFSYEMIALLIISSLFIIICVSDFRYYVISNEVLIIGSVLILIAKTIFFGFRTFMISIISGVCLFLFMYGIKKIGDKLFKANTLGGGDIKLASFFGFCLGVRLSIVSLIMGSLLAFPYAIYTIFSHKEKEIPFGPFLIGALLLVFLFMEPIRSFLNVVFGTF